VRCKIWYLSVHQCHSHFLQFEWVHHGLCKSFLILLKIRCTRSHCICISLSDFSSLHALRNSWAFQQFRQYHSLYGKAKVNIKGVQQEQSLYDFFIILFWSNKVFFWLEFNSHVDEEFIIFKNIGMNFSICCFLSVESKFSDGSCHVLPIELVYLLSMCELFASVVWISYIKVWGTYSQFMRCYFSLHTSYYSSSAFRNFSVSQKESMIQIKAFANKGDFSVTSTSQQSTCHVLWFPSNSIETSSFVSSHLSVIFMCHFSMFFILRN